METRFPPRNSIFSSLPSTFYAPLETVLINFFSSGRTDTIKVSSIPLFSVSLYFSFINVVLFFVLFFVPREKVVSGSRLFLTAAPVHVFAVVCVRLWTCVLIEKRLETSPHETRPEIGPGISTPR